MAFGKLFGGKKQVKTTAKAPLLSSAVEGAIVGIVGAKSIPTMPAAAQRAFQLSTDPKAEARDFVEVIESDESLSARVIKIANSVYFERGHKSETIEDSVVVIGINELRCLLNATTLSEIFPTTNPSRSQFWINDIATALISRQLAQRFLPGKEDLAFLAGLMHDVGKLLLLQRTPAEYARVLANVQEFGGSFHAAEEIVFPFTHVEAGQLIGERWHFSPEIIAVIRDHHEPLPTTHPAQLELTHIIASADIIAHALAFGHPRGFTKFQRANEEKLSWVWRALGIDSISARDVLQQLKKGVDLELDLYAGKKT